MKFIKNLSFMFQFVWKKNKLWLILIIINTLLGAVTPLVNITIPKHIVDSIFQHRDFARGMYWVVILVTITLLIRYMSITLGHALSKQKSKLFCSFNIYIAELIMDMDYKELENPETLDMKEKAMRSAFSGGRGFCGSIEVFFGIITNVIVFIGAALKIAELNSLLILVILSVVVLNTLFNSKINKDNYRLDKEKAPIERKNGYVFNLISDFAIGKEVRLYNLRNYIIKKYKDTSEESNRYYNKKFFNNTKNALFSSTTANLQLVFVYFVLLLCNKTDDFEFFEDAIVNIGAKGKMQRVVWNDPPYAFLSGNSFACAHVTSKIAEMIFLSEKKLTRETILDKFRQLAIEKHSALNTFIPQKLPFDIQNAAIFPFSKEMHSLLRYEHLLDFEIVDIYDTKYSAKVGSTSTHLMNDDRINSYTIKNINEINYDSFDTFIMGHMSELSMALKNENFVVDLVNNLLQHGKNIFSFDDITYYGFCAGNNIYFPSITRKDLPPTRLGMLHRIPKPVVGVFGTSSKQGKFTLQLKLKELLLNKGYKVGAIGSEPTSQLYGMEYVFPMGYDSTVYIQGNDVISYLNSAMHDISFKEKDIIIVGSQSGTIPYDYGNISQFPVFQYSFLLGTLPDCIVLCVNLFDSFEYIHRTILFLEASANSKVIALAVIPFVIRENGNNTFDISKELMSSKDFRTIQESFNSEFNIPLYNITSDDDAIELTQQIIDFFS